MSDNLMAVTTHQVPVRRLRHPGSDLAEENGYPRVLGARRDLAEENGHARAIGARRDLAEEKAHAQAVGPRRVSRSYAEILQEIRIAQTGSQVLLGFLLSLGFTPRFETLDHRQQTLYVCALGLAVAATALLVAPTAFRQLNFRCQMDHLANTTANRFVFCGLSLLMCSIIASLLFALSAVLGFGVATMVALGAFVWFVAWWYVFPFWSRTRHTPNTADRPAEPRHRLSA